MHKSIKIKIKNKKKQEKRQGMNFSKTLFQTPRAPKVPETTVFAQFAN